MEKLGNLLRIKKPTKGAQSERAELVGYFADQINKEREGTKFNKVTYRYIGVKLSHLSNFDLYAFKKQLEDYQARGNLFSKGFFGALKVKATQPQ